MEIIGRYDDGFILKATTTEIEKLDDKYYGERHYDIGTTIQVNKMYDQVEFLKRHRAEIATVQKNLRRINDNLTILNPFIAPDKEEENDLSNL